MFYVLSKILDVALTPLAWSTALLLAGILGRGRPLARRIMALAGVVVLLLFSLEAVANALWRELESPAVRTRRPGVTDDAVVLLGGLADDRASATWGSRSYNDNNERLLETYDILRAGGARYVVVSAGPPSTLPSHPTEAHILADQLEAWGVERGRIVVEERSRNTHENAVETAAIVRARGWTSVLVVTSGYHMSRALGCFRAEGLPVDTDPVDFRSFGPEFRSELIPRAEHLERSTAALREGFGRWVYRMRGYAR